MKKIKFNKYTILLIILIIFIILFSVKTNTKEKHIIESTEDYNLKIDYPMINNRKIKDKVLSYIYSKKKQFLEEVKNKENQDIKYDFYLNVNEYKKDDITYIYILTYSYIGGNHYIRYDYSLYFSSTLNDFVDITYFLKDEKYLNEISKIAYKEVVLKNNDLDISWIKEGTTPTLDNYSHFTFKNDGLEILFVPYQVGPWSKGEIKITIPYEKINNYLKDEYKSKSVIEETVELAFETRDLNEFKDKKLIAFTFDDGPSKFTTKLLLDNLDKYNAKVTFFVLGSRVNSNEDIIKRAYLEGHQIGSHTYNHRNLNLLSEIEVLDEINKTNEAIKEVIGVYPTIIRPPYGNIKTKIKNQIDMNVVLWNIDTLDWKYKNKKRVCNKIVKSAHDGAIILLHDVYKSSVEGALMAMEILKKDGYAFVTIDEMMQLKYYKEIVD